MDATRHIEPLWLFMLMLSERWLSDYYSNDGVTVRQDHARAAHGGLKKVHALATRPLMFEVE